MTQYGIDAEGTKSGPPVLSGVHRAGDDHVISRQAPGTMLLLSFIKSSLLALSPVHHRVSCPAVKVIMSSDDPTATMKKDANISLV